MNGMKFYLFKNLFLYSWIAMIDLNPRKKLSFKLIYILIHLNRKSNFVIHSHIHYIHEIEAKKERYQNAIKPETALVHAKSKTIS